MAILNINRDWQLALQLQSLIIIILILKETSSCIAWSGLFVPPIHQMAFINNYFNLKLANPKRLSPSYDIVISPFRGSSRFMDYDDMIDFHRTAYTSTLLVIWLTPFFRTWLTSTSTRVASYSFACDEDNDVENMFDFYLYQGCFFADIWNQETRNSRSLSRSFW